MSQPSDRRLARRASNRYLGFCIAAGLALGVLVGALTRNPFWIAWGTPAGVAIYGLAGLLGVWKALG